MKELFEQIEECDKRVLDGWCSEIKAQHLAAIIVALRPDITIEIGVFAGKSFIPMALAHKFINHGQIIGIDPYSNAAAIEGYDGDHKKWWGESVDLEKIFNAFVLHLHYFQVQDYAVIHRVKSDEFVVPELICFCHLDGNHSDQAIRDVERYAPKVKIGGIVVMDDISWPGGGVGKAVNALLDLGFEKLYDLDGGAVFQRLKRNDPAT